MIDRLIHKIKVRQAELKESMSVGVPSNFESYQRMVGEHQGLGEVLAMIDQLLEDDDNKEY